MDDTRGDHATRADATPDTDPTQAHDSAHPSAAHPGCHADGGTCVGLPDLHTDAPVAQAALQRALAHDDASTAAEPSPQTGRAWRAPPRLSALSILRV